MVKIESFKYNLLVKNRMDYAQLKDKIQYLEIELSLEKTKLRNLEIDLKKNRKEYDAVHNHFGWKEIFFTNWLGNPDLILRADKLDADIEFLSKESEKSKNREYLIDCNIENIIRNYLLDYNPEFKKLILADKFTCEFKDVATSCLTDVNSAIKLVEKNDNKIYFLKNLTQEYNNELWNYNSFVKTNPIISLNLNSQETKIELERIFTDTIHIKLFGLDNLNQLKTNLNLLESKIRDNYFILDIQHRKLYSTNLDCINRLRIELISS